MKMLLGMLAIVPSLAFANLHLAPPDFNTQSGRAVFVDFKQADYFISYDINHQQTRVKSRILFESKTQGKPIFDLVPKADEVRINGVKTSTSLINFPGGLSKLRQVQTEIKPGLHVLEIENEFDTNVIYHSDLGAVSSAFWIRDLKDRLFLEQYIPSNFEFDQYQMNLHLNFIGSLEIDQDIYTNGKVTQTSKSSWKIEFPDYYTVSCPFFHTTPAGWMRRLDFSYTSMDGRKLPITVYSPWKIRTIRFKAETLKVMAELEQDYGPWPHNAFVAYGTMKGTGGMEHAGATATSFGALDHEMLHSYFAKGVMPANGNSGWIDEAIASWRDRGYPRLSTPGFSGSNLGAHSVYKRNTDDRAYALGSAFMAYLDYRLQDIGGLKAFLKGYAQAYKHQVITTEHFKNNLEFFTGINLDQEFGTYIWGKNTSEVMKFNPNPNHPILSRKQLKSLL